MGVIVVVIRAVRWVLGLILGLGGVVGEVFIFLGPKYVGCKRCLSGTFA